MNKRNKGVRVAALVCVALLLFMYLATLIAAFTHPADTADPHNDFHIRARICIRFPEKALRHPDNGNPAGGAEPAVLEPYVFGLCALHGLCADFSAYPDQAFCHDVKEAGGGYDAARVLLS